ncbi:MAG: hypothetical protein ABSD52_08995 [Candidatus Cybelea sp.]|jgi:hypothetical protein
MDDRAPYSSLESARALEQGLRLYETTLAAVDVCKIVQGLGNIHVIAYERLRSD